MRTLLLVLLILTGSALANPTLQQTVEPADPVPFGKPVELILTLTYPQEYQPPAPDALDIPGAHVLDRYQVDGPSDGSHSVKKYHLVFTRLEPGEFEIPAIQVGSVSSKPVKVEFLGSTPLESDKEGEVRGPKSVVELSTADFWLEFLKWALAIVGILALLGWLFSYLGIVDKFRTPRSRALKRLSRLRKSSDQANALVLGCVEVLRGYLHEAYGFTTAEATSKEIVNQMTMDNRCRTLRDSVQGLLESGDSIKFAKKNLTESEAHDHFENLLTSLKVEPKVKS